MLSVHEIRKALENVCEHYEKTAPTVSDWADDLYRRLGDQKTAPSVRLAELEMAVALSPLDDHPNMAANRVYKMMERLGMDTTGQAGF